MEEQPPFFRHALEGSKSDNVLDNIWIDEDCEMSDSESSICCADYDCESDAASTTSNIDEDMILTKALARYLVDTSADWKDDKRIQMPLLGPKTDRNEAMDNVLPEGPSEPSFTVPFRRDVDFVGHKAILDQIDQKCSIRGSRTALVGLGGVGKSQIAIEFAYRMRDKSPETWVFWVHTGTRARFEEGYRRIAEVTKMDGWDDPKVDVWRLVQSWLCDESNGRWIMVVDNADDSSVLFPPLDRTAMGTTILNQAAEPLYDPLPQSLSGSVLITSRSRDVAYRLTGSNQRIVEVGPMAEVDAIALLQRKLGSSVKGGDAVKLVQALDYMPLAITQAAADIKKRAPRMTVAGYVEEAHRSDRDRSIHRWLSAPDPSVNFHEALKRRQHNTGLWFLEGEEYASWKEQPAACLWLHGIPGCGKTVLCSTILQDVLQHSGNNGHAVAYFYFTFNDEQKQYVEPMLRSLVSQLSRQSMGIPASLDTLCSSHEDGKRPPSLGALLEVMRQMIQNWSQVYIVIDALDECVEPARLTEILKTIAKWQLQNLHLILTSRTERYIESSLDRVLGSQDSICLQSKVVDKDIQQYVRQRLSDDKGLSKWGKDIILRQEIESALMKAANGMFRLVACQLDALENCRNRAMLRKSLATLPPTLDKTYDQILTAIAKEDSTYAIRILQWLTFSARPLTVGEVAEIAAIDIARDPAFDREEVLEDPLDFLHIFSSLVTIATDKSDGRLKLTKQVIVLAHYSVKEYLVSNKILKGQAAQYWMLDAACHNIIANACLQYLTQFQQAEPMVDEAMKEFKLARYSAEFWVSHAQKTEDRVVETSQAIVHFLMTNAACLNWIRIYDPERPWAEPHFRKVIRDIQVPLYYAALLNLEGVAKLLLDKGVDVNAQGGRYGNALQAASVGGRKKIAMLLLNKGADVNGQGGYYGNALQAASVGGHGRVVKLLLDRGANVNGQGGYYSNALQAASVVGHEQVVKLLLQGQADVDSNDDEHGRTPLSWAAGSGNEAVVKLLFETGKADADRKDGEYKRTPLSWAAGSGHEAVVKLLLATGKVDVDSGDGQYGRTPLSWAAGNGHGAIIKLLLETGRADADSKDGEYRRTPLSWAAGNGHEVVVKLLLATGKVDTDSKSGQYRRTPLSWAAGNGHEAMVKLLLATGKVDADSKNGQYGRTPLSWAAGNGHEAAVRLLLATGKVNADSKDGQYGRTPLSWAAGNGHEAVVKLLLATGKVDVKSIDSLLKWTPMTWAAGNGYEAVVELFLSMGTEVDGQGGHYVSALQAASAGGHE